MELCRRGLIIDSGERRQGLAIISQVYRMSEGLRIYNLFPTLAGTIRQWTTHLPRIAAMGFNAVYINPFHYPGFSGSLYAVKDYYQLNPRFRGDEHGDDDTLLRGFTDAAHQSGLKVIMDSVSSIKPSVLRERSASTGKIGAETTVLPLREDFTWMEQLLHT